MDDKKHILIFSHGFGVKKDDRGLLTAIAESFPKSISFLFDYNDFNESNNELTIRPFSRQIEIFKEIIRKAQEAYPGATIDVIAHSQGCLIPALSEESGIRKTVLLAPVFDMGLERTLKRHSSDPESEINLEGISRLRKLDGYIRLIPKEYWIERKNIGSVYDLYNSFSLKTELVIINANQDSILGEADISLLDSSIKVQSIDGDHGFTGISRECLIKALKEII